MKNSVIKDTFCKQYLANPEDVEVVFVCSIANEYEFEVLHFLHDPISQMPYFKKYQIKIQITEKAK